VRRVVLAASPWNNEQLFSSASVEWGTPEEFFDRLNDEFAFQLDACASEANAKVDVWIDEKANALTSECAQRPRGAAKAAARRRCSEPATPCSLRLVAAG